MSTKFTSESLSLPLARETAALTERIMARLCHQLLDQGFEMITPSALIFLSKLDCSDAIASDLARELGVSRQRIAKTVKDMKQAGYVEQDVGIGKRKHLRLTEQGRRVTLTARRLFSELDQAIVSIDPSIRLTDTLESVRQLDAVLAHLNAKDQIR